MPVGHLLLFVDAPIGLRPTSKSGVGWVVGSNYALAKTVVW